MTVSDYGKGLLTPSLLSLLLGRAAAAGIPSVVDPKGADYCRYRGAALVTPNRAELSLALGRVIPRGSGEAAADGARELMRRHGLGAVLVTRSEEGMTLVGPSGEAAHLPALARAVFDVSGAGDTVVACVGAALAVGADLKEAAELATLAAGVVVGKVGTATASPAEIRESVAISRLHGKGTGAPGPPGR
jgi:D-beta-D-heptose 7-phosphate kinase/D-beta-D-heptose 1-phosphate adenosyltransferase